MRRYRPQRRPAEFLHITRTQNETLEGIAVGSLSFSLDRMWTSFYIAIFFEVRPIHACTLVPLWTVRPTSGNRRRIALATQGARCVTAVSCPPDPCKKIRHLPSQ